MEVASVVTVYQTT